MEKVEKEKLVASLRSDIDYHQKQIVMLGYTLGLILKDIDLDDEPSLPVHTCD